MNTPPRKEDIGSLSGGGQASRRGFLALAGSLGAAAALGGLPGFAAHAAPARPARSPMAPEDPALTLWYPTPAARETMLTEALPAGNGRLGALVGGDPAHDLLYLTDSTMWTGGRNASLQGNGQFPYAATNFGSFTMLATLALDVTGHDLSSVSDYRRTLDLRNGLVTATYRKGRAHYRREVFVSAPDDVVVIRLTQRGGGRFTGSVTLTGTHGETTSTGPTRAWFTAGFDNGLRYAAVATAAHRAGTVTATGTGLSFTDCEELTVVVSGGTNYAAHAPGYQDHGLDPLALATHKAVTAATVSSVALLHTHVADYRALFDRMSVDLGISTDTQRGLDTWARLKARGAQGAAPDPELEASYLQYGRYLMICGSRHGVPLNLQGLWLDTNNPAWMSDYHTDINLEMNYWLADRAGLSRCFDALADYLLTQVPSWTTLTQTLFNDERNGFRNSTGRIAGWTTAISTNVYGGLGWWWHPAGNAWLCNLLFSHYEYTRDDTYLAKIYPLLQGACRFWQSRLLTTTVDGQQVLIDDSDWSPEQGPTDAKGITYAQELVWALFGHYQTACAVLGRDADYSATIGDLRERLYLPRVSPKTGWLEEWMTPDNLGDPTHRHLSPLVGLFPGDRIRPDGSPADLVEGARNLLTARGMHSYGWGCAWRALCWARLKNADNAYQLVVTNLKPSVQHSNGTAANFFDVYSFGPTASTFQIDANFGTPSAMIEMLLYSRPGLIELLPALPAAWARSGRITGVGARGGFLVDFSWRQGRVSQVRVHSVGGRSTTVRCGSVSRKITLTPGRSVTLRDLDR